MDENRIDLGFLEKCNEPWLLTNTYFPSKVGGRPAWLDVESIPSNDRLKCTECGLQLVFLCQVYAPLDDQESCFHRTIYVFICSNGQCWESANSANTIQVFRCQLPRENKFYEPTAPNEDIALDEVRSTVKLCVVCGCRGPLSCSVCRSVSYCSKEHQKIDWTRGEHKKTCGTNKVSTPAHEKHKYLLEEFVLVVEPEEIDETHATENDENDEARRLKDYEQFVEKQKQNNPDDTLANVPDAEFEKYTNQVDDDKAFHKFKEKISSDPEQVIRFHRGGQPLWITTANQLESLDIPACSICHGPRVFEFQIMPQLLNSYKDLDVDWGILAIYTCAQSCDTKNTYVNEYCYKQDICNKE